MKKSIDQVFSVLSGRISQFQDLRRDQARPTYNRLSPINNEGLLEYSMAFNLCKNVNISDWVICGPNA